MSKLSNFSTIMSFALLLLFISTAVEIESKRLCGQSLRVALELVCDGHYNSITHVRRSSHRGKRDSWPARRGGVVDECCRVSCSYATLTSYCQPKK